MALHGIIHGLGKMILTVNSEDSAILRFTVKKRPLVLLFSRATALLAFIFAANVQAGFSFSAIEQQAKKLADTPYRPASAQSELTQLNYEQWSKIHFREAKAPWLPPRRFIVYPSFPGYLFKEPVKLHLVQGNVVKDFAFDPALFDLAGQNQLLRLPKSTGYSGFKLVYPLNDGSRRDEVISFQGASYFRAIGAGQWFGSSARGIAVNTGVNGGNAEEFPSFREFWLVRPPVSSKIMMVYALLDSPSLTGAYQFRILPGKTTTVEVQAVLFMRRPVQKLGIAPLTSMFLQGENSLRQINSLRPEEHDADGLLIRAKNDEKIWRPLQNPKEIKTYAFSVDTPKGFGLIQRDRAFDHYQSLDLHYQRRPSVWVVPGEDWGRGHVELIELPASAETQDNIVTYWVPYDLPMPGKPFKFSYSLLWQDEDAAAKEQGQAITTLAEQHGTDSRRFVIDFAGGNLEALPEAEIVAVVDVGAGANLLGQKMQRNPNARGWRLDFTLRSDPGATVQLRAYLQHRDQPMTETWDYVSLPTN